VRLSSHPRSCEMCVDHQRVRTLDHPRNTWPARTPRGGRRYLATSCVPIPQMLTSPSLLGERLRQPIRHGWARRSSIRTGTVIPPAVSAARSEVTCSAACGASRLCTVSAPQRMGGTRLHPSRHRPPVPEQPVADVSRRLPDRPRRWHLSDGRQTRGLRQGRSPDQQPLPMSQRASLCPCPSHQRNHGPIGAHRQSACVLRVWRFFVPWGSGFGGMLFLNALTHRRRAVSRRRETPRSSSSIRRACRPRQVHGAWEPGCRDAQRRVRPRGGKQRSGRVGHVPLVRRTVMRSPSLPYMVRDRCPRASGICSPTSDRDARALPPHTGGLLTPSCVDGPSTSITRGCAFLPLFHVTHDICTYVHPRHRVPSPVLPWRFPGGLIFPACGTCGCHILSRTPLSDVLIEEIHVSV